MSTTSSAEPIRPRAEAAVTGKTTRALWMALGLVLTGIGFVGLFVPLLPTTDFLLLALPCFARSSVRLETWLIEHPRVGPPLRAWRTQRAIPRHAKIAATLGIAAGYTFFVALVRPGLLLALIVAAAMLACAIWILRRPSPEGDG
jgi:uncharacterized protein